MCPGAREGKGLRRREPHPLRRTLDTSALTKTARSSCCDSALSSATSAIPSGWRRECKSKVGWLCCGVNGWLVGCVVELRRGWGRGCVAGTNRIQQTSGRRPPRRQREQGAAGRVEGGAAHGTINRHPATINRSKTRMCHDIGLQAYQAVSNEHGDYVEYISARVGWQRVVGGLVSCDKKVPRNQREMVQPDVTLEVRVPHRGRRPLRWPRPEPRESSPSQRDVNRA